MTTVYLEVQLERVNGRFASKEDLANALLEQLDSVEIDESLYEITDSAAYEPPKPPRVRRARQPVTT